MKFSTAHCAMCVLVVYRPIRTSINNVHSSSLAMGNDVKQFDSLTPSTVAQMQGLPQCLGSSIPLTTTRHLMIQFERSEAYSLQCSQSFVLMARCFGWLHLQGLQLIDVKNLHRKSLRNQAFGKILRVARLASPASSGCQITHYLVGICTVSTV